MLLALVKLFIPLTVLFHVLFLFSKNTYYFTSMGNVKIRARPIVATIFESYNDFVFTEDLEYRKTTNE